MMVRSNLPLKILSSWSRSTNCGQVANYSWQLDSKLYGNFQFALNKIDLAFLCYQVATYNLPSNLQLASWQLA